MNAYRSLARFYELEHADFKDDLAMYQGFARRWGSPILELACGTGRVLMALAQTGHTVVGLDSSPTMLAMARRKIAALPFDVGARVTLAEADMRYVSLGERFALIIVALGSFMHLATPDDQVRTLTGARRCLATDGLLLIDLPNPIPFLLTDPGRQLTLHRQLTDPSTGHTILKFVSSRFDHARQLQEVTLVYDELGEGAVVRRTVLPLTQRYFFRYEMEWLLDKAGFVVEQVYGSYELEAYEESSERLIFVARSKVHEEDSSHD